MSAAIVTIDGYPLRPTAPDFTSQELLTRTLENCRAVAPLHPTIGQLFPEICKMPDPSPLLGPALKRLDWNLRENADGEQWAAHFGPMINRIFSEMDSATEEQLFFLCEWAHVLKAHYCHNLPDKIALFGWNLQKKAGLSDVILDQLHKAQRVFQGPGTRPTTLFQLAWTIFRAEKPTPGGDDLSWSASVRRDFDGMPKKLRETWLALLDANDHAFHILPSLPKAAGKLFAAFDHREFETTLGRWTQALASAHPLHVTTACLTLLNYLLRLCHALPQAQTDESLHRIASAKWPQVDPGHWPGTWPDTFCWLPAYLMVLPTRPATSAFACAEALMMNPATKTYADVERLYNSLLNTTSQMALPKTELVEGVDRFPIGPGHPLASEHLLIDQFLRASHPGELLHGGGIPSHEIDKLAPVRESLVRQSGVNLPNLVVALSERVSWLAERASDFPYDTNLFWRVETGKLMGDLLGKVSDPPLNVLVSAFRSDSLDYFGSAPSWRIFDLCQVYVEKHGWNADLLDAMRTWIKTLHGSNSALNLRRKAGWFIWFEDVDPIKPKECWSNVIRSGLRAMPAEERRLWMPLVTNASFAMSDKPPAKWLKPAKAAFVKLGAGKFRTRYREWFQPFRESEPLKLTIPGRDMLRLMIWYAIVAGDPQVDEALAWFAQAQWRSKDAADRAAKADTAFSCVLAQRNPDTARQAFERMIQSGRAVERTKIHTAYLKLSEQAGTPAVKARTWERKGPDIEALKTKHNMMLKQMMLQQLGAGCSWEGDTLVVIAANDTYRIDSITARITRGSDGGVVRVEIPYDAIPYKFFRAQIDAHDFQKPGEPNLMRTMVCARVILGGSGGPGVIVTDTPPGGGAGY